MEDAIRDYDAYFRERGMGGDGSFPSVWPVAFVSLACLLAGLAGYPLNRVEQLGNGPLAVCCVGALGGVVGLAAWAAYRSFRLRSGLLFAALLLAFVAVALYADWVWFFLLTERTLVAGPSALAARVAGLVETRAVSVAPLGWRGGGVWTVSGLALAAAYAAEAAGIFLGAALTAHLLNRRAFLCGVCRRWARAGCRLPPLYLRVPPAIAYAALAKGDVAPLLSAGPVPSGPGEPPHVVRVRHCACRRGALWVARAGRAVPGLQGVPLEPGAVLDLLDIARHATVCVPVRTVRRDED